MAASRGLVTSAADEQPHPMKMGKNTYINQIVKGRISLGTEAVTTTNSPGIR
jgi:hypothetical protein